MLNALLHTTNRWPAIKLALLTCLLSACQGLNAAEDPAANPQSATVAELSWLSGTWRGPIGERELEEQWSVPRAGSIAALVRSADSKQTDMLELVSISDSETGLQLRIQQWSSTMQPRSPEPQLMEVVAFGSRSVSFSAISEGGMSALGYSSPERDSLIVSVALKNGAEFDIPLTRVAD